LVLGEPQIAAIETEIRREYIALIGKVTTEDQLVGPMLNRIYECVIQAVAAAKPGGSSVVAPPRAVPAKRGREGEPAELTETFGVIGERDIFVIGAAKMFVIDCLLLAGAKEFGDSEQRSNSRENLTVEAVVRLIAVLETASGLIGAAGRESELASAVVAARMLSHGCRYTCSKVVKAIGTAGSVKWELEEGAKTMVARMGNDSGGDRNEFLRQLVKFAALLAGEVKEHLLGAHTMQAVEAADTDD
jgi:hypothetical protein